MGQPVNMLRMVSNHRTTPHLFDTKMVPDLYSLIAENAVDSGYIRLSLSCRARLIYRGVSEPASAFLQPSRPKKPAAMRIPRLLKTQMTTGAPMENLMNKGGLPWGLCRDSNSDTSSFKSSESNWGFSFYSAS